MQIIIAGDTFAYAGPALFDGAPVDMSGWSAVAKLRRDEGGQPGDLIAALSCTITTPATAVINISATSTETATWEAGPALLDIRFTTNTGAIVTTLPTALQIQEAASR